MKEELVLKNKLKAARDERKKLKTRLILYKLTKEQLKKRSEKRFLVFLTLRKSIPLRRTIRFNIKL